MESPIRPQSGQPSYLCIATMRNPPRLGSGPRNCRMRGESETGIWGGSASFVRTSSDFVMHRAGLDP
jgi:hypothetical protein